MHSRVLKRNINITYLGIEIVLMSCFCSDLPNHLVRKEISNFSLLFTGKHNLYT